MECGFERGKESINNSEINKILNGGKDMGKKIRKRTCEGKAGGEENIIRRS